MSARLEKPVVRPILGFGWLGWCALGLFALICLIHLCGIDLQYGIQRLIAGTLGAHACERFTNELQARWIACAMPGFSPLGILYVLVFLHVAARRIRAWELCIVVLWWLIEPSVRWYLWWNMQAWFVPHDPFGAHMAVVLREGQPESGLITAVVLWLVTRSVGVLITVAVWSIISLPLTFAWAGVLRPTPVTDAVLMASWWHVPIVIAIAVWAVRSRHRALRAAVRCVACGYDLRGIGAGCCPECGTERWMQAPIRSPTASGETP